MSTLSSLGLDERPQHHQKADVKDGTSSIEGLKIFYGQLDRLHLSKNQNFQPSDPDGEQDPRKRSTNLEVGRQNA
jgi:hypothetical protein